METGYSGFSSVVKNADEAGSVGDGTGYANYGSNSPVGTDIVSDLGESHAASFSYADFGDVEPGLYYHAQREGQEGLGSYFLPVKPIDSLDVEIMTNIKLWDNNADQLATVRVKPGLQAWQGGVQGGTGEQLLIPIELHPDYVEPVELESLFKTVLKTNMLDW